MFLWVGLYAVYTLFRTDNMKIIQQPINQIGRLLRRFCINILFLREL